MTYAKVEKLSLNVGENDIVACFYKGFEDFDLVSMKLRFDTALLSDARALFGGVVDKNSHIRDRLNGRPTIVENTNFEQAIAKKQ